MEKNSNIITFKTEETESFKWFVVHTYSGYENKVALGIKDRVEAKNQTHLISRIVVPTTKKIIVSAGKKREVDEKFYPGYVLVKVNMNPEIWHIIRKTDHVTGFIGTRTNPIPLTEEQALKILGFMKKDTPKYEVKFKVGDSVKVLEGPFKEFLGRVDQLNETHGKAIVLLSSFGREVPVDFDLSQITPL